MAQHHLEEVDMHQEVAACMLEGAASGPWQESTSRSEVAFQEGKAYVA